MSKKIKIFLCVMALTMCFTGLSIPAGAVGTDAVQSNTTHVHHAKHCQMYGGQATALLSEITGKSTAEINKEYPQKTAWQAAKAMGKLDDLKKAYLARHKVLIDSLVEDKKIDAADGAKMFADLQKRVAAIDGVNIVIPGKPEFVPQIKNVH